MTDNDGTGVAGSGVSFSGGAIIGSDDNEWDTNPTYGKKNKYTNDWWRLDNDCHHQTDWGFWVCPRDLPMPAQRREVISLRITLGNHAYATPAEGSMHHFGNAHRNLQVGTGGNTMFTGACCDIGWYLWWMDGTSKTNIRFYLDQMVTQGGQILAVTYPGGSSFQVSRCLPSCRNVQRRQSLQDVIDGDGLTYFVDNQGNMYLKLVNPNNGYHQLDNVKLLTINHRREYYQIKSSKSGSVTWSLPDALPHYRANPMS